MSSGLALSGGVAMRYALIVELSVHSDPCVPARCGWITPNTGGFAMPLFAMERKGWQVEAQILGLSKVDPEG